MITKKERNLDIDFLRFIGLSLIILAHTAHLPEFIKEIRSFDVPLMVFVSALTLNSKSNLTFKHFVINRTKRLVIPVYIFLSFFFLAIGICYKLHILNKLYPLTTVIGTYLFLDSPSIGFVWIMRIFLLMMMLTPLLVKINTRVKSDIVFCIFLVIILLTTNYLNNFFICKNCFTNFLLNDIILYSLGYSAIYLLGIRIKTSPNKYLYFILSLIGILITCIIYYYYHGSPIKFSTTKYPPHSYFLTYGTSACIILYTIISKMKFSRNSNLTKTWSYISRNSIWIYLWHIIYMLFSHYYLMLNNCILDYVAIYTLSVLTVYIQEILVNKYLTERIRKYLVG